MNILKRNYLELEASSKTQLEGEYRLVKRTESGIIVEDTGWFENTILTGGLNRWGTAPVIAGVAIGTNNTPANNAQTALLGFSAYTTTIGASLTSVAQSTPPYYTATTVCYRFAVGALNGTYSEIGVGWLSTNMFSRALIVNGSGVAQSITVASTEALDVYYRIRIYPPAADSVYSVIISGTTYTVTTRASSVTDTNAWFAPVTQIMGGSAGHPAAVYSGPIGAITSIPSGTSSNNGNGLTPNGYVNNSLKQSYSYAFGLTNGNVGGASSWLTHATGMKFQHGFSPAITKDSTKTLTLNCEMVWAEKL